MDNDFVEHQRQQAIHKWKWRNPSLVAFLTFLHPLGILLTSIPAFFIYMLIWLFVYFGWKNHSILINILLSIVFSIYAYFNTKWKNAAIEKWKYGLPGTGKDNPKKYNLSQ